MDKIKNITLGDYVIAECVANKTDLVSDSLTEANKKIDKLNKKLSEIEKLIPNHKIGEKIITKNLRVLTIKKIDYKKKLGFLYGGNLNFQVGNELIWFNENEFLDKYKGYEDYEYKLVRRVKELENEIELMKKK